jgi:hypothetical protein
MTQVNSKQVRKLLIKLDSQYKLLGNNQYLEGRDLVFKMPAGYKYLAASLGDPYRLLGYAC